MATDLVERTKALLANGESSRTAIACGTKELYQAVELVKTPGAAESLLAQSDAFLRLAKRRLEGSTAEVNEIHRARFALMALVGGMLPPSPAGRGKTAAGNGAELFDPHTIAAYRKVYSHVDVIDGYFREIESADDGGGEASLASLLRHIQAGRSQARDANYQADLEAQNNRARYLTPDGVKAISGSPAILVGPAWWRGDRDFDWLEDFVEWKLADRLDEAGGFIIMRTLGSNIAKGRADVLLLQWGVKPLPWQIIVTGKRNEELVIGTAGSIDPAKYLPAPEDPKDPHVVLVKCPAAGVESLVRSWVMPWAEERGTPNLMLEVTATEKHAGWQFHPWEPAQC